MTNTLMIPKFRLPGFIAGIGRVLPQWPHSLGLIAGLNLARQMKLLPEEGLEELAGKVFRVRVKDTGGEASFTYRDGAFRPVFRVEGEPDLAFAANLSAYLQLLARQEDPDTLFFNRELEIIGDTELGLRVKNMLDAVEWPNLPFIRR
ncbi:MAG: ubiquinone anaerobic biosynthesis accessory factor UbiT [Betaproteobacteria bacterium]|jgi:predicted lipid carrier protein YhbT